MFFILTEYICESSHDERGEIFPFIGCQLVFESNQNGVITSLSCYKRETGCPTITSRSDQAFSYKVIDNTMSRRKPRGTMCIM